MQVASAPTAFIVEPTTQVARLVHHCGDSGNLESTPLTTTIVEKPGTWRGHPGKFRHIHRDGSWAAFSPIESVEFFSADGDWATMHDVMHPLAGWDRPEASDSIDFEFERNSTRFALNWTDSSVGEPVGGTVQSTSICRDPYELFALGESVAILDRPYIVFEPSLGCKRTVTTLAVVEMDLNRSWHTGRVLHVLLGVDLEPLMGTWRLKDGSLCGVGEPWHYRRHAYLTLDGRFVAGEWSMHSHIGMSEPGWTFAESLSSEEANRYVARSLTAR